MTNAIIVPKIPSKLMCHIKLMIAATTVDNERIASNNASLPDATNDCEFISLPIHLTYLPKKNFTTTATAIMNIETKV